MAFFLGRDVDGKPIYWTQDEQDEQAIKPFPGYPHIPLLVSELMRPIRVPTEAETTLGDKSRRMMFSTVTMGLAMWMCLFKRGRKVFVSRQTQEEAERLLMDKVRRSYEMLPDWFQQALPMSMEPKNVSRFDATNSEIICVSQAAADRAFRGNAGSIVIIDEAAVQEFLKDMLQSANSMAQRVWVFSSPNSGNPGAIEWNRLLDLPTLAGTEEVKAFYGPPGFPGAEGPGYSARTTENGYRVITLRPWAIPGRDADWLRRARQRAASHADFLREQMGNRNITDGDTFYPEFYEVGEENYLYEPNELLDLPVLRGWDLGVRHPFCVWLQYSPTSDRVYVLREFGPTEIAAHHFRDVCLYLSGQLPRMSLPPEGEAWAKLLDEWPGVPRAPWFPVGTVFADFTSHEADMRQSIAAINPAEATLRQVWAAGGIEFQEQAGPVRASTDIMRRLLPMRADGRPGILISPVCVDVRAMFGSLTYRKPTKANPKPGEPRKDGKHDDCHDALRYAISGVVPAEGIPGITAPMLDSVSSEIGWS